MKKILVIGGGASGIMAALSAVSEGSKVTIYEKNNKIGKKILATGNGKCNMTNLKFSVDHYYVDRKTDLIQYFNQFSVEDTIHFFNDIGLMIREKDGYVYPYSEQASTVLEVLSAELEKRNVNVVTDIHVTQLKYLQKEHKFQVSSDLKTEKFDSVILACGSLAGIKNPDGAGYEYASCFSHKLNPLYPALVQIRCKENFFKMISGVRAKVRLSLFVNHEKVDEERGELQLTDYGISGIAVFQISRQIAIALDQKKVVEIEIDFMADLEMDQWKKLLQKRIDQYNGCSVRQFMLGTINKKLIDLFLKQANINGDSLISKHNINEVLQMMYHFKSLKVTADKTNSFENAQVCAGGIDMSEITDQMESKLQKGLYFCGEMLDVDGKCGGYNLQWAWTSGYIAGFNAGRQI